MVTLIYFSLFLSAQVLGELLKQEKHEQLLAKEEQRKRDRAARDAYRLLLRAWQEDAKFHPKTDFKALLPALQKEPRFQAVQAQPDFDPASDFAEHCKVRRHNPNTTTTPCSSLYRLPTRLLAWAGACGGAGAVSARSEGPVRGAWHGGVGGLARRRPGWAGTK